MNRYEPKVIEPKWQQIWQDTKLHHANLDTDKETYVGFGMFNYPSGAGIHIGHAKNFTLPDILLRYNRMLGKEVYSPVGFDSFGLPAENYAIKTGQSPRKTTDDAIENYRTQYRALGWMQDWNREIDTSQPEYYKWTQWIFTKLYEHGLAYQGESPQWWCDQCKTVLANEQVVSGKCWRHDGADDSDVTKRTTKQWFFKITDEKYLEEILQATDELDWTPHVKVSQKKWIGKSTGTEIDFEIEGSTERLAVFTTAHETIYGATFMVLAPEHELVPRITSEQQKDLVQSYVEATQKKSDVQRQASKQKSGVFTGAFAIHPLTGAKLPIWIADYVLASYGSGAIMAVPGQDMRDYEFAQEHDLEIIYTTDRNEFVAYADIKKKPKSFALNNSGEFNGLDYVQGRKAIMDKLISEKRGNEKTQYKIRDWLISRQRYWGAPIPIIHCSKCGQVPVAEKDLPVVLPEIENYEPTGGMTSVLAGVEEWVNVDCPSCGKPAKRETDTMDGYVCSSWYMLRYLSPNDDTQAWDAQRAKKWMPVDFYNGGDHATAHLLYARFFMRFFYKLGMVNTPEPFKRMYFHSKIMAPDGTAFSKSKGNGIDPLEIINSGYGADALRLYIVFMAPPDLESPWNDNGVPGTFRFLNRVWELVQNYVSSEKVAETADASEAAILRATHRAIQKVTEDISSVKLNTAVAALMQLQKELSANAEKHGFNDTQSWQFAIKSLLTLMAPFAPHITEELWSQLGNHTSIHVADWPQFDKQYLVDDIVTVAVQINGKLRGTLELAAGTTEQDAVNAANADPKISPYVSAHTVRKIIYVPDKILNFVV